jgi:hypothetical protein
VGRSYFWLSEASLIKLSNYNCKFKLSQFMDQNGNFFFFFKFKTVWEFSLSIEMYIVYIYYLRALHWCGFFFFLNFHGKTSFIRGLESYVSFYVCFCRTILCWEFFSSPFSRHLWSGKATQSQQCKWFFWFFLSCIDRFSNLKYVFT